MLQAKMIVYSSKSSKGTLFPVRSMLVFFIALFGLYACYFSFTQIALENEEEEMNGAEERTNVLCKRPSEIPYDQMQYVHFPRPMSYDRGECACTPVRFLVIISMQRSGSGWFETLLNSHPNVSSNGEIFSVRERREDIASILWTLDKLYDLDWRTSAAKNECTAAFGLKWMLNQGLMDYPDEIVDYLIKKGVMVIFLFRRNTLRRLVSVLANDHDKKEKQLNGTHKAHVHSQEEAEILARFKPEVDVSSLIPSMRSAEQSMDACLRRFRATRHMILYYEDLIRDNNALSRVQEFLGLPVRRLSSRHVKIHTSPLPDLVDNWEDVRRTLKPTLFARFLDG
ncbi:nodulation protein H-like [Triticum dicoccoides]|uniref:nodulation protein H-like n=1 Tax=Triticum dicoccoides TaxID=85692 RepID=UPI000E7D0CD7|nr:nodulation protein H-like [Triticum dicoccoides]XP_037415828.1 nodulation protein H-like [Triticum dicoccoides]XP_037415835.1 nodulation protein H-like [Triticum dicoccoides]XP_037415840.1 nodulation protein H-like [Triticum dicoccoides]XP_037415847.1 nodulation protein H-like [Triticum dicoccoides]XP_037415852.1 nodulation protein H-like [Triticum dicoccoides]